MRDNAEFNKIFSAPQQGDPRLAVLRQYLAQQSGQVQSIVQAVIVEEKDQAVVAQELGLHRQEVKTMVWV